MPTVEVVAPGEPLSSDRSVLSTIRGEAESPGDVLERQGSKLVKQHTMHYQMREVGKPWIGFAVRKAKNKDGILVRDVAKGGPAEAAGLQDGDQLVSIESMRIATMKMFKVAMTEFKRPGLVIEVGILRSGSPLTVKLEIGVKKQVDVGEVPPLTSSEEILDVLGDSVKLEQVAKAAFAAADADCSGLVTTKEFISAMREWLPAEISPYLGDNDLRKSFTNCDTDKSGYLGLVEFPRIMKGLLSSILEGERGLFGRRAASAKSLVMLGAPYAGWVVHKKRGVKRLYLVDIVEGGPADEAGLHENDELISVDGTRVGSYPKYRQLMKQCMVPGGKMTITYRRRGKKFSTELTVGTREPAIIQNVPQLHVMEDIGTVLNDEEKFSILAEHAFQSADADMSGLVTHQELLEALESWRPLAGLLSAEVLMEAVSLCDADESGYIAKREFPGFLRFLLNLVWRWHQLNSYPPMEVTVGKHPLPVQTHNIYQEWNTEGFLCGNFPAAPKKAWLRTTNQAQRPHFIVAVDSKVTLKKLNGLEQTVVLSPGDEVFIPQGTYYDYQSDDAESHFLFALGIGKASPMKLSFLESAAQSFRKGQIFHPWLGFQAEKDPTKKNQLLVREVPWGGPAAAAGMTDGDVLQSIDGTPVKSLKDFRKMVTECKLGDVVAVRVSRTEVSIGFEIEVKSSRLQNSLCAKKMTFASIKEIDEVLESKKKVVNMAADCFADCDRDLTGMVTREEFPSAMMDHMKGSIGGGDITDEELLQMFDEVDVDRSSYLTADEYLLLIPLILKKMKERAEERKPKKSKKSKKTGKGSAVKAVKTSPAKTAVSVSRKKVRVKAPRTGKKASSTPGLGPWENAGSKGKPGIVTAMKTVTVSKAGAIEVKSRRVAPRSKLPARKLI